MHVLKTCTSHLYSFSLIGCYRFSDRSFIKYLDYNTTSSKLNISAPIFRENNGTCTVKKPFKFTRDGFTWKENNGGFFMIRYRNRRTEELQVNLSGDPICFEWQISLTHTLSGDFDTNFGVK